MEALHSNHVTKETAMGHRESDRVGHISQLKVEESLSNGASEDMEASQDKEWNCSVSNSSDDSTGDSHQLTSELSNDDAEDDFPKVRNNLKLKNSGRTKKTEIDRAEIDNSDLNIVPDVGRNRRTSGGKRRGKGNKAWVRPNRLEGDFDGSDLEDWEKDFLDIEEDVMLTGDWNVSLGGKAAKSGKTEEKEPPSQLLMTLLPFQKEWLSWGLKQVNLVNLFTSIAIS